MKLERVKAVIKQPWLRACLISAVCASLLVSVYYSKDRWIALTAIGTIGAVVVALYLSINAKKEERRKRSIEAMIYVWSINSSILKITDYLDVAIHKNIGGSLRAEEFISKITVYKDLLSGYDFPKLYDYDPSLCVSLNQLRNGMEHLLEWFYHHARTINERDRMLKDNLGVAQKACGLIRFHDPSSYLK